MSFQRLLNAEREVYLGGWAVPGLAPLRLFGRLYPVRPLSVRGFLHLWAALARMHGPEVDSADLLARMRKDPLRHFLLLHWFFLGRPLPPKDLLLVNSAQAEAALVALEQTSDLTFLFGQVKRASEGGTGKGEGEEGGVVQVLATFLQRFPGYTLDSALSESATAFFALLASGSRSEGAEDARPMTPEERAALTTKILAARAKKRAGSSAGGGQ